VRLSRRLHRIVHFSLGVLTEAPTRREEGCKIMLPQSSYRPISFSLNSVTLWLREKLNLQQTTSWLAPQKNLDVTLSRCELESSGELSASVGTSQAANGMFRAWFDLGRKSFPAERTCPKNWL
jgi:hypothetical protein